MDNSKVIFSNDFGWNSTDLQVRLTWRNRTLEKVAFMRFHFLG